MSASNVIGGILSETVLVPDAPETRAVLAKIIALPPKASAILRQAREIPVAPKSVALRKSRVPPTPDKRLTSNPPYPLIKAVDDELVLRGMAYGTRKSDRQHLRNYFDWLTNK